MQDPTVPAAKRQKTTSTAVARKRVKKTLSDLPNMPIDVLFEIFSRLAPSDLLNLCRTTKAFRRLLMSRQSTTVWKSARLSIPRALECPSDVSEPYWANLIYGGANCEFCDQGANRKRLFFELRRRLCIGCFARRCITPPKNKKEKPKFDLTALELVPFVTYRMGRCKPRPYFWKEEVDRVAKELKRLRGDVKRKKPHAAEALESYRQTMMARARAIMKHSAECYAALERAAIERPKDLAEIRRERHEHVCARFVELGYDEDEVKSIVNEHAMTAAPLTPRAWQILKKQYTPLIQEYHEKRVAAVERKARRSRLAHIRKVYEEFLQDKPPLERVCLPRVQHAYKFRGFQALLALDPAQELLYAEFAVLKPEIPRFIAEWSAARDTMLLNLVTQACQEDSRGTRTTEPHGILDPSMLGLATFVTVCRHDTHAPRAPIAVGRREVAMHAMHNVLDPNPCLSPCDLDVRCLSYVPTAAATAAELVRLVGLDERKATPTEMDKADARFLCEICCPAQDANGVYLHSAMDWRRCLEHSLDEQHRAKQWRLLDETERATVEKIEESSNVPYAYIWACNRCANLKQPMFLYRADVVGHLVDAHGAADPIDDRDVFVYPSSAYGF